MSETTTQPATRTLKSAYSVTLSLVGLYKKIKPLKNVINASTVLPILEDFCIMVSKSEGCRIIATDLENFLSVKIPVLMPVVNDFQVCINALQFTGFLKDASIEEDAQFTLEYTPSANVVYIRHGGFKIKITTEEAKNFPAEPIRENTHSMTLDAKEIIPHFKKVKSFMSNDDLRPAMTGVYIHDVKGKGLTIAATDAHKLYWHAITPKTPSTMKEFAKILPRKGVNLATEIFDKGELKFSLGANYAFISGGDYVLATRFIDARYPDYESVIPEFSGQFFLKRKQMLSFLKLSMHFVNRATNQVNFEFSSERESVGLKGGDLDFDFELSYNVPAFNIKNLKLDVMFGMNAKFLQSILLLSKDEYIKVSTDGLPTKAFIFDDNVLIMPLMLNQ